MSETEKELLIKWEHWLDSMDLECQANPINAKLSNYGLIIPGYNGVQLDKEKSFQNMKFKKLWVRKDLIWKEVRPNISIADLPVAPINCGNPQKASIAFMINVAWGNEYLVKLIRIFKEKNIRATFFLLGAWLNRYPDLGRLVKKTGHEIGNHAYSHSDMRGLNEKNILWEIKSTNQLIQKELDFNPHLFTPPSQEFNKIVIDVAAKEGMYTILSTIAIEDWNSPSDEEVLNKIKKRVQRGSLILLHPTASTLSVLPSIFKFFEEKKYSIGTVSQVISSQRI